MQKAVISVHDLKTDFYKRYTHDGGMADTVFCPYSAVLFGGTGDPGVLPALCLRLSFGASAAFRRRNDDRLVFSLTDSDIRAEINKINIEKLRSPKWAKDMAASIARLPLKLGGIEMLIRSDVSEPELAPKKLCAVQAAANAFCAGFSPAVILRAAGESAHYLPSLLDKNQRAAIVNTATLDYLPINFSLPAQKIIIIRVLSKRSAPQFTNAYRERELERLNSAAEILKNGSADALAPIMRAASRDMLSVHKKTSAKLLFSLCTDFTDAVRIMPDYRGAAVFMPDAKIDEFTRLVSDRYEKKAGVRPAFYISD